MLNTRLLKTGSKLMSSVISKASAIQRRLDLARLPDLNFTPRDTDIFIVTYPRSGTTWMQMTVYQLLTDGDMSIPHISAFSPWYERVLMKTGMNPDKLDACPDPRVFKSHLSYPATPKGRCRYIYIMRDGLDVIQSYFSFYGSHMNYKGSFEQFFKKFCSGHIAWGSWFEHVKLWTENKADLNCLFLRFEDMVRDFESVLVQVADFLEVDILPQDRQRILDRCSFQYMKQHEAKFDHTHAVFYEKQTRNKFIRAGKVGEGKSILSETQLDLYNDQVRRQLSGLFGKQGFERRNETR